MTDNQMLGQLVNGHHIGMQQLPLSS